MLADGILGEPPLRDRAAGRDGPPAAALAPVAGEPALARVVRSLLGRGGCPIRRVVVVVTAVTAGPVRSALEEAGLAEVGGRGLRGGGFASPVPGGRTEHLGRHHGFAAHVLVHDHRWPLASTAVTDRVLAGLAAGHPVVVPVLPMTDTVKPVDDAASVVATVDRATLRTVQYPRGFVWLDRWRTHRRRDDSRIAGRPSRRSTVTPMRCRRLPADAALLEAVIATSSR